MRPQIITQISDFPELIDDQIPDTRVMKIIDEVDFIDEDFVEEEIEVNSVIKDNYYQYCVPSVLDLKL